MTLDSSGLVKGHKLHERTRPWSSELESGLSSQWSEKPHRTHGDSFLAFSGAQGQLPEHQLQILFSWVMGKTILISCTGSTMVCSWEQASCLENPSEILAVFSVQQWGCREGFLWLLPHDWTTVAASSLTYMPHWSRTQAPWVCRIRNWAEWVWFKRAEFTKPSMGPDFV